MALIEVQTAKHFMLEITQLRGQKIPGGLGRGERRAGAQRLRQLPPGYFDRRLQLRIPRKPKAALGAESLPVSRDQLTQGVKTCEHIASEIEGRMPRCSRAQQDGQQLSVGQRRRTLVEQLLTRSFVTGPIPNC